MLSSRSAAAAAVALSSLVLVLTGSTRCCHGFGSHGSASRIAGTAAVRSPMAGTPRPWHLGGATSRLRPQSRGRTFRLDHGCGRRSGCVSGAAVRSTSSLRASSYSGSGGRTPLLFLRHGLSRSSASSTPSGVSRANGALTFWALIVVDAALIVLLVREFALRRHKNDVVSKVRRRGREVKAMLLDGTAATDDALNLTTTATMATASSLNATEIPSTGGGNAASFARSSHSVWSSFRIGAVHVHRNFLPLFFVAALLGHAVQAALYTTLTVARAVSPPLGDAMSNAVSWLLLRVTDGFVKPFMAVSAPFAGILILIPAMLALLSIVATSALVSIAVRKFAGAFPDVVAIQVASDGIRGFIRRYLGGLLTHLEGATDAIESNDWVDWIQDRTLADAGRVLGVFYPFLAVLFGPVVEELIFRGMLQQSVKSIVNGWPPHKKQDIGVEVTNDNASAESDEKTHEETSKKSPRPLIFGFEPWIFLSSFLFGISHISNWTGPLRNLGDNAASDLTGPTPIPVSSGGGLVLTKTRLLTLALGHFVTSFFVSLHVFSPVYDKLGLAAAIGAHSMWNLSAQFLELRTVIWMIRLVKERFGSRELGLMKRPFKRRRRKE